MEKKAGFSDAGDGGGDHEGEMLLLLLGGHFVRLRGRASEGGPTTGNEGASQNLTHVVKQGLITKVEEICRKSLFGREDVTKVRIFHEEVTSTERTTSATGFRRVFEFCLLLHGNDG